MKRIVNIRFFYILIKGIVCIAFLFHSQVSCSQIAIDTDSCCFAVDYDQCLIGKEEISYIYSQDQYTSLISKVYKRQDCYPNILPKINFDRYFLMGFGVSTCDEPRLTVSTSSSQDSLILNIDLYHSYGLCLAYYYKWIKIKKSLSETPISLRIENFHDNGEKF